MEQKLIFITEAGEIKIFKGGIWLLLHLVSYTLKTKGSILNL